MRKIELVVATVALCLLSFSPHAAATVTQGLNTVPTDSMGCAMTIEGAWHGRSAVGAMPTFRLVLRMGDQLACSSQAQLVASDGTVVPLAVSVTPITWTPSVPQLQTKLTGLLATPTTPLSLSKRYTLHTSKSGGCADDTVTFDAGPRPRVLAASALGDSQKGGAGFVTDASVRFSEPIDASQPFDVATGPVRLFVNDEQTPRTDVSVTILPNGLLRIGWQAENWETSPPASTRLRVEVAPSLRFVSGGQLPAAFKATVAVQPRTAGWQNSKWVKASPRCPSPEAPSGCSASRVGHSRRSLWPFGWLLLAVVTTAGLRRLYGQDS